MHTIKHHPQGPMQHLYTKLPGAFTGMSSSGEHFQVPGAAHWHNKHKLCTAHPMFLACLGRKQAGDRARGLKWTSTMQDCASTPAPAEVGAALPMGPCLG